jgi:hypothetical protein
MTRIWDLVRCCVVFVALAFSVPALAQGSAKVAPERQVLVMVKHPPDHFRPSGAYGGGGYGDDLARSARERLARLRSSTPGRCR